MKSQKWVFKILFWINILFVCPFLFEYKINAANVELKLYHFDTKLPLKNINVTIYNYFDNADSITKFSDEKGKVYYDSLKTDNIYELKCHSKFTKTVYHMIKIHYDTEQKYIKLPLNFKKSAIMGNIVDATLNNPVINCKVKISKIHDPKTVLLSDTYWSPNILFTDTEGRFHLSGLDYGKYQITLSKTGYTNINKKFQLYKNTLKWKDVFLNRIDPYDTTDYNVITEPEEKYLDSKLKTNTTVSAQSQIIPNTLFTKIDTTYKNLLLADSDINLIPFDTSYIKYLLPEFNNVIPKMYYNTDVIYTQIKYNNLSKQKYFKDLFNIVCEGTFKIKTIPVEFYIGLNLPFLKSVHYINMMFKHIDITKTLRIQHRSILSGFYTYIYYYKNNYLVYLYSSKSKFFYFYIIPDIIFDKFYENFNLSYQFFDNNTDFKDFVKLLKQSQQEYYVSKFVYKPISRKDIDMYKKTNHVVWYKRLLANKSIEIEYQAYDTAVTKPIKVYYIYNSDTDTYRTSLNLYKTVMKSYQKDAFIKKYNIGFRYVQTPAMTDLNFSMYPYVFIGINTYLYKDFDYTLKTLLNVFDKQTILQNY